MITKWYHNWIQKKALQIANEGSMQTNQISVKERAMYGIAINSSGDSMSADRRLETYPDLAFRMYHAENGMVMEVRYTDRKTERNHHNLHVISSDQDLGEAISHIITLESLKIK